ncbi:MAG TPA: TauD/TfdA family dioxygenase [Blastocatellia bacterium]
MNAFYPPVLVAPAEIATAIETTCMAPDALETLEHMTRTNEIDGLPFLSSGEWLDFSARVRILFAASDYLIIRGLPVSSHGATLLAVAQTVGSTFRTYRGGQIVKHFKMSPWTTELSHTTREGEFHTDLNTEPRPPAITAMQCLDPDPGAPRYGVSRVARLADLLAFLEDAKDEETLHFIRGETVTMLNDRAQSSWSGHVVEEGIVRYHPETLRAAARRSGHNSPVLEDRIAGVAGAALAVSEPFLLEKGDVLLLSNHRTLHYRGECSVVFRHYPMDFASRSLFILHTAEESREL